MIIINSISAFWLLPINKFPPPALKGGGCGEDVCREVLCLYFDQIMDEQNMVFPTLPLLQGLNHQAQPAAALH